MDTFVQCHFCKKAATNPVELVCRHSFCSDCLEKKANEKIKCPICNTENTTPLMSAQKDTVIPYLIGLKSGTPYANTSVDASGQVNGECGECKTKADLTPCPHCEKPICAECRGKHNEAQKKDVKTAVQDLVKKTNDLVKSADTLNKTRVDEIEKCKKMKEQVAVLSKDLIKRIQDEEQELHKAIDDKIRQETENIKVTEQEKSYFQNTQKAVEQASEKCRNQDSQMVSIKMHKHYLDVVPAWKGQLDAHTTRLNVKKDDTLHIHVNKADKTTALVAVLADQKGVHVYAPVGAKRVAGGDPVKSRACTIL